MRGHAVASCALLLIITLVSFANAGTSQYGVAGRREVQFDRPVYIYDTLVPAGTYEVRHVMQGEEHLMVFSSIHTKLPPVTVRAKCTLVPLGKASERTEVGYKENASGELVLVRLQFKGDTAKHIFNAPH
jgi:hypothetical protein